MSTKIELTAKPNGTNVEWEIDGGPAKSHKTKVNKGAAPETIKFKLDDQTKLKLRFDCSFPFQVWENEGCPPACLETDQIAVVACSPDTVTIVDVNTGPERTLHYQLNVVSQEGACPCDPIIENGGGGTGFD